MSEYDPLEQDTLPTECALWKPLLALQEDLQNDPEEVKLWSSITNDLIESTKHISGLWTDAGEVGRRDLVELHFWLAVSICRHSHSRERLLARLSTIQINSLRLILRWTSETQAIQSHDPDSDGVEEGTDYARTQSEQRRSGWPWEDLGRRLVFGGILNDLCEAELSQQSGSELDDAQHAANLAKCDEDLRGYRNAAAAGYVRYRLLRSYIEGQIGYELHGRGGSLASEALEGLESSLQRAEGGSTSKFLNSLPFLTSTILPYDLLPEDLIEGSGKGLPLYLWDIRGRRTVRTIEIPGEDAPRYAIVSHTWGRWTTGTKADMTPQVPWLVPENSKFDVQILPDGLEALGAKLALDYVWFDLLCIPQDYSEEAQLEIARQAVIFGNALIAVVWFSDVDSWTAAQDALGWAILTRCIRILQNQKDREDDNSELTGALREERYLLSEKMAQGLGSDDTTLDPTQVLTPFWFTSLWTLQESIMRPDMLLANRCWNLLEIEGSMKPVRLNDLVVSIIGSSYDGSEAGTEPQAVKSLYPVFKNCYIGRYINSDHPLNILSVGTSRHCKDSRSEAIMSVVGARDWYVDSIGGPDREESLVLGTYNIAFLQELRDKYGHLFFLLRPANYGYVRDLWGSTQEEALSKQQQHMGQPLGTMLPFWESGTIYDLKFLPPLLNTVCSIAHPSVQTWVLRPDGSVYIPQAAIIWVSPGERRVDGIRYSADEAFGLAHVPSCTTYALQDADALEEGGPALFPSQIRDSLVFWMEFEFLDATKYAIVLSYDSVRVYGQVLKELPSSFASDLELSSHISVAKIADFEIQIRGQDADGIPIRMDEQLFTGLRSSSVDWLAY